MQKHLHSPPQVLATGLDASGIMDGVLWDSSGLGCRIFAPDAGEGGLDLLLEAGDQFAVGGHQRLLGFDLGHDGLLRGEGWEGDSLLLDKAKDLPCGTFLRLAS